MNLQALAADAAAAAPTPPATVSVGYHTDGNPASGQPASLPGAYYFHQLASELQAVLIAGGVTPHHLTLNQLLTALQNLFAVPPGTVRMFAMATLPSGYLNANGALVSRSTYSALFTAIGTTYGVGDGSTTFALPDYRGRFPRFWDDSGTVDPGRAFGSFQKGSLLVGDNDVVSSGSMPGVFGFTDIETHRENLGWDPVIPYTGSMAAATAFQAWSALLTGVSHYGVARPANMALRVGIKF